MELETDSATSNAEVPPSPTVEAPPTAEPVAAEATDFTAFSDESDDEPSAPPPSAPTPEGTPVAAAPASSMEAPPVQMSPTVPVAVSAPPGVPPVVQPAPAAPQPVAPVAAPATAPLSDPIASLAQQRENLVTEIAARYAMPEAVRDQFNLEPEKVLPVFAARLYVDVFDAVLQTIQAQIPAMMGQREQSARVAAQAEGQFFTRWPGLKDPQFTNDIVSIGRAYRQQNPSATMEQAVEAIGAMVTVARGVVPPSASPAPSASAPPQPQFRPPVPAGAGASRSPVPAVPQASPWDSFISED